VPEIEMASKELKRYKSPQIDPIPSELIKAGGRLINIWNEEELTQQGKKSIIVHIYNNGNKTDCSNYQGITLLSPTYEGVSKSPRTMLITCKSLVFHEFPARVCCGGVL
jgi:hypothetical protein